MYVPRLAVLHVLHEGQPQPPAAERIIATASKPDLRLFALQDAPLPGAAYVHQLIKTKPTVLKLPPGRLADYAI